MPWIQESLSAGFKKLSMLTLQEMGIQISAGPGKVRTVTPLPVQVCSLRAIYSHGHRPRDNLYLYLEVILGGACSRIRESCPLFRLIKKPT